jgi:hypothetical protein
VVGPEVLGGRVLVVVGSHTVVEEPCVPDIPLAMGL